jgi:hypothetical protein
VLQYEAGGDDIDNPSAIGEDEGGKKPLFGCLRGVNMLRFKQNIFGTGTFAVSPGENIRGLAGWKKALSVIWRRRFFEERRF